MLPTFDLLSLTIVIVTLFLTVLVRTTYQLKIFACFPFLRTVILPMFVEYSTRQVLNLARFVAPFLYITPLHVLNV